MKGKLQAKRTTELFKDCRLPFKAVMLTYERCTPRKVMQVHLEKASVLLAGKLRIHPCPPVTVRYTHAPLVYLLVVRNFFKAPRAKLQCPLPTNVIK